MCTCIVSRWVEGCNIRAQARSCDAVDLAITLRALASLTRVDLTHYKAAIHRRSACASRMYARSNVAAGTRKRPHRCALALRRVASRWVEGCNICAHVPPFLAWLQWSSSMHLHCFTMCFTQKQSLCCRRVFVLMKIGIKKRQLPAAATTRVEPSSSTYLARAQRPCIYSRLASQIHVRLARGKVNFIARPSMLKLRSSMPCKI